MVLWGILAGTLALVQGEIPVQCRTRFKWNIVETLKDQREKKEIT
jgi:hypothetical protein